MAYVNGRTCYSNRGRSLDLDHPRSDKVQRIRDLMGSVSPSGGISRKTNTKYYVGGTMLLFTVGENEAVNIWMDSYMGGHSVNIVIRSVYLLADGRYCKAVRELLSKFAYDAYKDIAEIEARPLSERFVYVGYADGDLPKDSWGRIWFGEADGNRVFERTYVHSENGKGRWVNSLK